MADIIQLLPDNIANQIAAGEVIQRPASVVKELLENAIDAGSTAIKLVVKDAGKTLIQVIDDGKGMSDTDARMAFERHATSKIREANDLFAIRTMGFRGEALASIAAIAQVELKTRQTDSELGAKINIEASTVKNQTVCQCSVGTSIAVKNLFFNVPARRNFLKSNPVEMRHIIDEFQRVALANCHAFFSLHHNNVELFHLPAGNLRQRVVGVFGQPTNKKLVPINEATEIVSMEGFIGKPEFAKKTRGEQFFFVNNRFIKSGYLNHAIMNAYEELLPKDTFPFYVIFIDIDPKRIDINVHPTKQEIKFDDEKLIYNYLKVAVRHALGQYSVTPTLDFDQIQSLPKFGDFKKNKKSSQPVNKEATRFPSKMTDDFARKKANAANWQKLYEGLDEFEIKETTTEEGVEQSVTIKSKWTEETTPLDDEQKTFSKTQKPPYQIHNTYVVSHIKSGFLLIDQHIAHERILYEQFKDALKQQEQAIQQELFPETIRFTAADADTLRQILAEVNMLGFHIEEFGKETFVVHGVPVDFKKSNIQQTIETLLEQYKTNIALKLDIKENLARALAKGSAIKRGKELTVEEMQHLIDKLFACEMPYKGPSGKACFVTYELDELAKQFG